MKLSVRQVLAICGVWVGAWAGVAVAGTACPVTLERIEMLDGQLKAVLSLESSGYAQEIYCASGAQDGGDTTNGWDSVQLLDTVGGDETTCAVAVPDTACFRYFLIPQVKGGTPVSYLKSSGHDEYIATGIYPDKTTKVELDFTQNAYVQYATPFGEANGSAGSTYFIFCENETAWTFAHSNAKYERGSAGKPTTLGTHRFVLQNGTSSLDGTSLGTNLGNMKAATLDAYLFACHFPTTPTTPTTVKYFCPMSLYGARIYQSNALVRAYVPCVTADGVPALYDQVNATFAFNATSSTNTLQAGTSIQTSTETQTTQTLEVMRDVVVDEYSEADDVRTFALRFTNPGVAQVLSFASGATDGGDSPSAWDSFAQVADIAAGETYRRVTLSDQSAYCRFFLTPVLPGGGSVLTKVSSSGTNEYVPTGVYPDKATKVELDFTQNAYVQYATPFGEANGSAGSTYFIFCHNDSTWGLGHSDRKYEYTAGTPSILGTHRFVLQNGTSTLDGTPLGTDFGNMKSATIDAYLFACHFPTTVQYFCPMSLYGARIYSTNVLVRAYWPCLDKDGTPALFDSVNQSYAYNQGATALTAGTTRYTMTETFSANEAKTAIWTGAGQTDNFADPANWICTNFYNQAILGTPGARTAVTVTGAAMASFQVPSTAAFPACQSLTINGALAGDVDWRGLAAVPFTGTVDLKGHTVSVRSLPTAGGFTDTSTGACGTVSLEVPEGGVMTNATAALTGNLRLVKSGAGTFRAVTGGQSYTGGTCVTAGTLQLGVSGSTPFGSGALTVQTNAVYEVDQVYSQQNLALVLAGGTLRRCGALSSKPWENVLFGPITLTADSRFDLVKAANFVKKIDLGGHRLDVTTYTDNYLAFSGSSGAGTVTLTNGTLCVTGTGWLSAQRSVDAKTVDLDIAVKNYMQLDTTVHEFRDVTWRAAENNLKSAGRLYVSGTFKPLTATFYHTTLRDGATLDLSVTGDGVWSAAGLNDEELAYVEGATIAIVPQRKSGQLIAWTQRPAKVTFTLAPGFSGYLDVTDTGVFLRTGLIIILK